jgi:hypothetical protein
MESKAGDVLETPHAPGMTARWHFPLPAKRIMVPPDGTISDYDYLF